MTVSAGRLFFIWVTENGSHEDHAVTDEENAARTERHSATYVALCGDEFIAADMREAPGARCARCAVIVEQWGERSRLIHRALSRPRESPGRGLGRHACRATRLGITGQVIARRWM